MLSLIKLAGKIAVPVSDDDRRSFWLGCVGIRNDGVMVSSRNGNIRNMFSKNTVNVESDKSCEYHAEGRALRKMDKGGILYVARISRKDGSFVMSRPCPLCQAKIKAKKIEKVYYSINNRQYGVYYPSKDLDKVFTYS